VAFNHLTNAQVAQEAQGIRRVDDKQGIAGLSTRHNISCANITDNMII